MFENCVNFGGHTKDGKAILSRYAVDNEGNVHRFDYSNDGTYHWNGSTGDKQNPKHTLNQCPIAYQHIKKDGGEKIKMSSTYKKQGFCGSKKFGFCWNETERSENDFWLYGEFNIFANNAKLLDDEFTYNINEALYFLKQTSSYK